MNEPVERVSATSRFAVPAHQVFLAVTDPAICVGLSPGSQTRVILDVSEPGDLIPVRTLTRARTLAGRGPVPSRPAAGLAV